ncbi:MAG: hypothetical protein HWD61_15295 [Parachlamydiaceae bacterium]|nr:MAG: hypothetical protein HWD61_15295 [Parachlamydiaceae bacterium]
MSKLYIGKNHYGRFDLSPMRDPMGRGINGYHGILDNIIGFILEKIFHKTVSFEWQNGSKTSTYYFNCKSFAKWYHKVHPDHPSINSFEKTRMILHG